MAEQIPHDTSLFEYGGQIFDMAARDSSGRFTVQPSQWPDGRTAERVQYQASPIVNVQITRPGIDTEELIKLDTDNEHGATPQMEVSIVSERRFRMQLENGEWYVSNRLYVGIYNDQAFLLSPVFGVDPEGKSFIDGWQQKPVHRDSEWWLQDIIKPQ